MAENNLDEQTAEIASRRNENGKEIQNYEDAKTQLQAINNAKQQNLAAARSATAANAQATQTLGNAGAVLAESQPAVTQTNVNPATQAILSKYGMGAPKVQKSTSSSQQVTKQNVTINNTTNNTTTNNVQTPAGPSPAAAKPAGDNTGKFKVWLNNTLARQNEENARKEAEYDRREQTLSKDSNKILRKLGEFGKEVGEKLDPRKIGGSLKSQIKSLLFIFGFQFLASNWTNILKKVSSIEKSIKRGLNYIGIKKSGGTWTWKPGQSEFYADITSFFTGKQIKPGEKGGGLFEGGFLGGMKKIFLGDGAKDKGLFGLVKEFFQEQGRKRMDAAKQLNFPDIDLSDIGATLKGVGQYLGDLLGIFLGDPETHVKNNIRRKISKEADQKSFEENLGTFDHLYDTEEVTTATGKQYKADAGVKALIEGKHKGYSKYSLDSDGNLNKTAEASISAARDLESTWEKAKTTGKIDSDRAALGFSRLYKAANESKNKTVAVNKEFVSQFLTPDEIKQMESAGKLKLANYSYVVKPVDEDKDKENPTEEFVKETLKRKGVRYLMDKMPIVGNLYKLLEAFPGVSIVNDLVDGSAAAFKAIWAAIKNAWTNDYRLELVSDDDLKPGDELTGETAEVYEVSDEGIKDIINKQRSKQNLGEISGEDIDVTNSDYLNGWTNSLVQARKDKVNQDNQYKTFEITDEKGNKKQVNYEEYTKWSAQQDKQQWNKDYGTLKTEEFVNIDEQARNRAAGAKTWKSSTSFDNAYGLSTDLTHFDDKGVFKSGDGTVSLDSNWFKKGDLSTINKEDLGYVKDSNGEYIKYSDWLRKQDKFKDYFLTKLKNLGSVDGKKPLLAVRLNKDNIDSVDWQNNEFWDNLNFKEPVKSSYSDPDDFVDAHEDWEDNMKKVEQLRARARQLRKDYDTVLSTADQKLADSRFNHIKAQLDAFNDDTKDSKKKIKEYQAQQDKINKDIDSGKWSNDYDYGIDTSGSDYATNEVDKLNEYSGETKKADAQFKEDLQNNSVGNTAYKAYSKIKELGGKAAEKIEDIYGKAKELTANAFNKLKEKASDKIDYAEWSLLKFPANSKINDHSLITWAIVKRDWTIGGKSSRFGAGRHNTGHSTAARQEEPFDRFHEGQDMPAEIGTPIYAPFTGFITSARNAGKKQDDPVSAGTGVDLRMVDASGKRFIYICHLSNITSLALKANSVLSSKYNNKVPKLDDLSEIDRKDVLVFRGQQIAYSGGSGTNDGKLNYNAYQPHIHIGVGEYGKKGPFDGPFPKPLSRTKNYMGHKTPQYYVDPMDWYVNDDGDLASSFYYLTNNNSSTTTIDDITKHDKSAEFNGDLPTGEGESTNSEAETTGEEDEEEESQGIMSRIWDYIKSLPEKIMSGELFNSAVDTVKSGYNSVKNSIGNGINSFIVPELAQKTNSFRGSTRDYKGPIYPEFTSYRAYKENHGVIPEGLSKHEWQEYVYDKTGSSPVDLVVDDMATLKRANNQDLSQDTKNTLNKYTTNNTNNDQNINNTNNSNITSTEGNTESINNNSDNSSISSNIVNSTLNRKNEGNNSSNTSSENNENSENNTKVVNADKVETVNNSENNTSNTTVVNPNNATPTVITPSPDDVKANEDLAKMFTTNPAEALKDKENEAQKQFNILTRISDSQSSILNQLNKIVQINGEDAKANATMVDSNNVISIHTEMMTQLLAEISSKAKASPTIQVPYTNEHSGGSF